jgi:hypothetical protein
MKISVERGRIRFSSFGGCGIGIWHDGKASATGLEVKINKAGKVITTKKRAALPELDFTPTLPVRLWIVAPWG